MSAYSFNTMQECHYSCKTCNLSATTCTSCDISASFRQDLSLFNQSCPCKPTFYDIGVLKCESILFNKLECLPKCSTCTSAVACSVCNTSPGTFRINLVPDCPCMNGFFDDGLQLKCQKCHARCSTCITTA